MRLLITGGAGFIGSAVIRYLMANDYAEIINFDKLTYAASPAALDAVKSHPNYCFAQGDIVDAAKLKHIFTQYQPDAIMHLAAETHVDRSIDGPGAFITTNITGTFCLLEAAREYWQSLPAQRRAAFRFHHVSTDEVFGALGSGGKFTETTRYDPHSPYAASKAAADHLSRAWHDTYGLPVVISNCSNNYGPYQFPEKLIPLTIIRALNGETLPIYGKGANIRDWLYVEDHAAALWQVLTQGKIGETYNIGGDAEHSNYDVVTMICAILDQIIPRAAPYRDQIRFVADRPGHDYRYAMDFSKITRELGWSPQTSFPNGLKRTVEWFLEHKAWWQPIRDGRYDQTRLGLNIRSF